MNKTYCPYAWNHFSARVDGAMRLCCNSDFDTSFIKDNNGKHVSISDITDLNSYFNLNQFKRIRKNMIQGIENSECSLCYRIEKNGGVSIRQYAVDRFPYENFKAITNETTGEINSASINYIDLAWSNKCNLQCRMCDPRSSDQLVQEWKDLGILNKDWIVDNKINWSYDKIGPLLSNIVSDKLQQILVTGGEPLINNDFYKLCEIIIEKDLAKNIEIGFHTNLNVLPQKWISILSKFKHVFFKVSIDAVGDLYEYIRYPAKWHILKNNIDTLCAMIASNSVHFNIEFHTVFSVYNAHGIVDLLSYLITLPNTSRIKSMPHLNYVFGPNHCNPYHLPQAEKMKIKNSIDNWIQNSARDIAHFSDKVAVLNAVVQMMIDQGLDNGRQKDAIEKIKLVDSYRKQDTAKYLPWINEIKL
jgi:sulfatase maturation enzyme AslB (radical SAM superfamily)